MKTLAQMITKAQGDKDGVSHVKAATIVTIGHSNVHCTQYTTEDDNGGRADYTLE